MLIAEAGKHAYLLNHMDQQQRRVALQRKGETL